MKRKSILSGSWYPDKENEIADLLEEWTENTEFNEKSNAAVSPHAGWYYSGKTSSKAVKCAASGKELVVVIGGHLPPGSSVLAAFEEEFETPLGIVKNRKELLGRVGSEIKVAEDIFQDNTVEVVLPMVKYFSPEADLLWMRAPADQNAVRLGTILFNVISESGLDAAVIGSTDLTHYGSNYGFTPKGAGRAGLEWVKDTNDAEIIELLVSMDFSNAVEHANKNRSACSIGAAVAAGKYAELKGAEKGTLIEYTTSYDIMPAESFVGYAGIIF